MQIKQEATNVGSAIIRFWPEPTMFNGWWSSRAMAERFYRMNLRAHPNWMIALVHGERARFVRSVSEPSEDVEVA